MRKQAFYLDTNVFSHLADSERTDHEVRRRLALLVRSRAIEVIGAPEIIEEFAGMARANPEQFVRSIGLFWTLVGDKVLVGRKNLLVKEVTKGSMLSRPEAFLDAETVHQLQSLPLDSADGWDEITMGVRGQGEDFTNVMHKSAEKIDEVVLKSANAKEVRKNAGQMDVSEKTIKDWYESFLRSDVLSLGLSEDEAKWPNVGLLPCMRAFVSIFVALAKKHHMSYRHHYRGGDKQDVDHYTNAAIPGCLVTSDRALRDTSSLITWRSFSVIAPEEFLARVRRL